MLGSLHALSPCIAGDPASRRRHSIHTRGPYNFPSLYLACSVFASRNRLDWVCRWRSKSWPKKPAVPKPSELLHGRALARLRACSRSAGGCGLQTSSSPLDKQESRPNLLVTRLGRCRAVDWVGVHARSRRECCSGLSAAATIGDGLPMWRVQGRAQALAINAKRSRSGADAIPGSGNGRRQGAHADLVPSVVANIETPSVIGCCIAKFRRC